MNPERVEGSGKLFCLNGWSVERVEEKRRYSLLAVKLARRFSNASCRVNTLIYVPLYPPDKDKPTPARVPSTDGKGDWTKGLHRSTQLVQSGNCSLPNRTRISSKFYFHHSPASRFYSVYLVSPLCLRLSVFIPFFAHPPPPLLPWPIRNATPRTPSILTRNSPSSLSIHFPSSLNGISRLVYVVITWFRYNSTLLNPDNGYPTRIARKQWYSLLDTTVLGL